LKLLCHLPETYPSQTTPLFELIGSWLGRDDEAALAAGLESVVCVCVCVCMYVCVCVCVYTYINVFIHTHTHTHTYI
jgi:hypothetical protein